MENPKTTEAQTEATTPEIAESAQEQLDRIEREYKTTRARLLKVAKNETKDAAQEFLENNAAIVVKNMVVEAKVNGLKLNNFTIRFKAGDVVEAVEAVDAVEAVAAVDAVEAVAAVAKKGNRPAVKAVEAVDAVEAVEAVDAVEAVEAVSGISTVLNVVRAPKNSPVTTVVEPDPVAQVEVQAAAATKAQAASDPVA